MLENFERLWKPKTTIDDLVDIYYKAFKKFSEKNLLRAAESCMNELEFFPKPIDLTKRYTIQTNSLTNSVSYGKVLTHHISLYQV